MKIEDIKIGDVIADKWGVTMSLYSFYQVIKKTDKTITIRPMRKATSRWCGFMECEVKPIFADELAKTITKRADKDGNIYGIDGYMTPYNPYNEYIECHAD